MKQNEKPFFKTQKKTKKKWNINQCKKKRNRKRNRENGVFLIEKRRQKKRVLLQSQKVTHFFGTVLHKET